MRASNMRRTKNSMRELSNAELDQVAGGTITKENGGGHTPGGEAFGVPSKNPAGKDLGSHNKRPPF